MTKLYCYVDETGQDTKGEFFIVVVVVVEEKDRIEEMIELIERKSGKDLKWNKSSHNKRSVFFKLLLSQKKSYNVYYSKYNNVKDYDYVKSLTVKKVLLYYFSFYQFSHIIIDGATRTELNKLRAILKRMNLERIKLKGGKDETLPSLRLADSFAGLIRDSLEESIYAKKLIKKFVNKGILYEI